MGPGEVVYLIEADAQLRGRLFNELMASGVAVQSFECPDEYLCLARPDSAACVIFDVQPLHVAGIDPLRELTGEGAPPLILVSAYSDIQFAIRAIKAGAIDFLIHPVKGDALSRSVNEALRRDRITRQRRAEIANLRERYSRLTQREREVLALLAGGYLNKQVAVTLAIREGTVKAHRAQITHKLGAGSFAELVRMTIKLRLLDEDGPSTESSFPSVLPNRPMALA